MNSVYHDMNKKTVHKRMTFEDDRNWEKLFAVSIVFEKVLNARNSFDNAG